MTSKAMSNKGLNLY